jgi:hypothetical protein
MAVARCQSRSDRGAWGDTPLDLHRSIANLKAAILPAVPVPKALPCPSARGLYDVGRRRLVVNRRRWCGTSGNSASEQRATDKSADYASSNIAVLSSCRGGQ